MLCTIANVCVPHKTIIFHFTVVLKWIFPVFSFLQEHILLTYPGPHFLVFLQKYVPNFDFVWFLYSFTCFISLFRLHTTNFGITLFSFFFLYVPIYQISVVFNGLSFTFFYFFSSHCSPSCICMPNKLTVPLRLGSLLKFIPFSFFFFANLPLRVFLFFSPSLFFSLRVLISTSWIIRSLRPVLLSSFFCL